MKPTTTRGYSAHTDSCQGHVKQGGGRFDGGSVFRFDADTHTYRLRDVSVPSVTQLLVLEGLVDDRFYTDEGRARGTAVHDLCKDYDLQAMPDLTGVTSPYKAYLHAYAAAMAIVRPAWDRIEIPTVHPVYRFGCRADRVGTVYGSRAVCEIKSGAVEASHPIQLALQAIAECDAMGLPAYAVQRFAVYVRPNGKFSVDHYTNPHDVDRAFRIIRRFCR